MTETNSKLIKKQFENSKELINQNNSNSNPIQDAAKKNELNSFIWRPCNSYYRDKILFPFKYYIFDILLKNLNKKNIS